MENKISTRSRSLLFRLTRVAVLVILSCCILFGVMFTIWLDDIGVFDIDENHFATIIHHKNSDNTIVFDRDGGKIGEIFNRYHVFVPYKKLPKELVQAIIAIEDRNFFQHRGVDLKAIVRAALDRLGRKTIKQGASTITQQLVRHFLLSREKSLERKVKEAFLAMKLETKLGKEEILQLYTNVLFLGNGSYGVGAAAQRYFGRNINSLKTHELALIAGLFQSPSRYNPHRYPKKAKKRQRQVLFAMHHNGVISKSKLKYYLRQPLKYKPYQPVNNQIAPYFVDFVRDQAKKILGENILNRGLRIYTTLDSDLQKMGQSTLKEKKDIFEKAYKMVLIPHKFKGTNPSIQGALMTVDPRSGEIKSMIGGRDYHRSKFNRTIQARRQPGSAFKPIVYSLALASGMKWSDLIYVSPVAIKNYRPKNFSKSFLTEVTMLRAFFRSINTPAVEIGSRLGLKKVLEHAKNMGIETPLKTETGSMLGGSGVSMLDLLRVYGTIANSGVRVKPYAISKITDANNKTIYEVDSIDKRSTRILSKQDSFLMMEGMKTVFRHGTAYAEHDFAKVAAGKTGTSNGSRDNWFVGYTPELATAVWVGSDKSFEFLGRATGTSLALPIWANYMKKAIKKYIPSPFDRPEGIVRERVHSKYGYITSSGMNMYFKKGYEPSMEYSDLKVLSETGKYRTLFEN